MQPFVSKIVNGKAIGLTNIPENMSENQKQSVEGWRQEMLELFKPMFEKADRPNATIPWSMVMEEFIDSLLSQQQLEVVETIKEKLMKAKIWKLVPNTPRMIMCSDKELKDFLQSLSTLNINK